MKSDLRPLAVVSFAAAAAGLELAWLCVEHDFDVIVVASDEGRRALPQLALEKSTQIYVARAALRTCYGLEALVELIGGRQVHTLILYHPQLVPFGECKPHLAKMTKVVNAWRVIAIGAGAEVRGASCVDLFDGDFLDSFSWALVRELEKGGVEFFCHLSGLPVSLAKEEHSMEFAKAAAAMESQPDIRRFDPYRSRVAA